jgi:hypothetical protein
MEHIGGVRGRGMQTHVEGHYEKFQRANWMGTV